MKTHPLPSKDDLALTALLYAAGELPAKSAESFMARMAHDQAARDALANAIRLSAAALGQAGPTPDPLVRTAALQEVRPTMWSRLFPLRRYRGHPLAWAGVGGLVAAGLTAFAVWLGDPPETDDRPVQPVIVRTEVIGEKPAPVLVAAVPEAAKTTNTGEKEPRTTPITVAESQAVPVEPAINATPPWPEISDRPGGGRNKTLDAKIGEE